MNVSFKQLTYVRVAAELRSITNAAQKLNISQSSIGAAVDIVEREYEVQIFIRQPSKGLKITSAGRNFLSKVDTLMAAANEFESQTIGRAIALQGEISVGCFSPMSAHFLPPLLKALTKKLPSVQVNIHESDIREVQTKLLEGHVDLILTYDLGLSDRVEHITFGEAPPHVILSTDNRLVKKQVLDLKDIVNEPMILLDLPESRTYFELLFSSAKLRPKILHRTENYETVRGMVAAGLGFSILNLKPIMEHSYGMNQIACRPLDNALVAPSIIVGWRRGDVPNEVAKTFINICGTYFQSDQARMHFVTM